MGDKILLSVVHMYTLVILPGSLPAVSQPGVDHGPRQLAFLLMLDDPWTPVEIL